MSKRKRNNWTGHYADHYDNGEYSFPFDSQQAQFQVAQSQQNLQYSEVLTNLNQVNQTLSKLNQNVSEFVEELRRQREIQIQLQIQLQENCEQLKRISIKSVYMDPDPPLSKDCSYLI